MARAPSDPQLLRIAESPTMACGRGDGLGFFFLVLGWFFFFFFFFFWWVVFFLVGDLHRTTSATPVFSDQRI